MIIKQYNDKTNLQRRKEFIDWLGVRTIPHLKLCEMVEFDGEVSSTKDDVYNGPAFFNPMWNTRYLMPTELRIEFDHKDLSVNLNFFYTTCINLIKANIHYCTFYAVGQRCPHIIIYDLLPEEGLTLLQKKKARELFCKKVVPMEAMYYLDRGLLGPHKVCLEFAKHWRHQTVFDLMFEHVPDREGGNNGSD